MKKTKSILLIVGAFVLGIIFCVVGVRDLIHTKQLAARGKSTVGQVLDGEDSVSGRMQTHTYYLTINFKPDEGSPVTKKVRVSHKLYDATTIGGPVKVWYLPEDPTICAAGDKVELRYGNIILAAVMIGMGIFLIITFNSGSAADAAEKIDKQFSLLTVPRFEYAPANPAEFKNLDMDFYDQGQRWLESLGYTFVADEENLTVSNSSGRRTLLRRLVSRDRTTLATFYHFKHSLGREAKVLDLETWVATGGFVCTSNAASAGKLDYPPQIDAYFFPSETPLDAVLQGHEARLNTFYAQNPGVSAYALGGIADVRRFGDEMQRVKSEFRSGKGLSRDELERISGKSGPLIDEVHDALKERQSGK